MSPLCVTLCDDVVVLGEMPSHDFFCVSTLLSIGGYTWNKVLGIKAKSIVPAVFFLF